MEKFIFLDVLPAAAVFDNEAVGDEEVVAEEDGEEGVGEVEPDVESAE